MQGRDDVIHAATGHRVWFRGVPLKVQTDVVSAAGVRSIGGRNDLEVRDEIEGCPLDAARQG
jgi:hypothetical protein